MGDQSHQNYFDTDWANVFNNHDLVSTNHQNLGGNNYTCQNHGENVLNSQNVGNNYTNQNSGEILQSNNFNQYSSLNDIIYQNLTTTTNINHHPNNSFEIGEGSYQNSINSTVTTDQNNNEQLLIYIASQLQNIQNAINQFLVNSRNNNR
nr:8819_t:CDS:1 [Entrophospora candida]